MDITSHPVTTWVFEEGTFVPVAKLEKLRQLSIVSNYMGTPEVMYDDEGSSIWSCSLNSYGKVRNFKGDKKGDCPFRYQGQYEDAETGLYYNRFRYYSPDEGMYISQDPIGLMGGHELYSYVDDTNFWIDQFGLAKKDDSIKKKAPMDLGEGYRARKDIFQFKGEADFEVHVYKVKGKSLEEVGGMNSKGG